MFGNIYNWQLIAILLSSYKSLFYSQPYILMFQELMFKNTPSGIFTIGRRYRRQSSDTSKAFRHIPLRHYTDYVDFTHHRPLGAVLVGVEMGGIPLKEYVHPEQAIYLLGAEDYGLPEPIREKCNHIVSIESLGLPSYNVAIAGSLIMYDRMVRRNDHDK